MKLKIEYMPLSELKAYSNNAKYEVYAHIFPNNKVYIGITSYGAKNRWHGGYGYKKQQMMWRAIQKYGWDNIEHKVLFDGLTENEAKQKEIELIALYKSDQREYGYNIRHGGDISAGYKLSEETRDKMSEARKGDKNWIYGKHLSEETKRKLSIAHTGKKQNKEAAKRGALNRTGSKNYRARKVDRFDLEGNFIKTYDCLADGGRDTNTRTQDIYNCCTGRQKKTHGNIWRYHYE